MPGKQESKETTTQILGWQLRCHDKRCSGPEIWGWVKEKPESPVYCPTCGWLALSNDGIRAIEDEVDDVD